MHYIYHYKATYHGQSSHTHLDGVVKLPAKIFDHTSYNDLKDLIRQADPDIPDSRRLSIDSLTLLEGKE